MSRANNKVKSKQETLNRLSIESYENFFISTQFALVPDG
jgi:hypothetical protein